MKKKQQAKSPLPKIALLISIVALIVSVKPFFDTRDEQKEICVTVFGGTYSFFDNTCWERIDPCNSGAFSSSWGIAGSCIRGRMWHYPQELLNKTKPTTSNSREE